MADWECSARLEAKDVVDEKSICKFWKKGEKCTCYYSKKVKEEERERGRERERKKKFSRMQIIYILSTEQNEFIALILDEWLQKN